MGFAHVQWSESRGSGKNRHTVTYRSREVYVDAIVPLQQPPPGSSEVVLSAGNHEYPFQMQLPAACPQSFESITGRVRYMLEAHVDIPWAFDERYNLTFTTGVEAENSKTLCCLCCASGPIHAKFTLERTGFVPGEAIAIKAEVNNGSNRTMSSSFVTLIMQTSYHAQGKTKTVTTEVAKVSKGEIAKGDTDVWYGEKLHIPAVPASDLPGCNIIHIKYMVVFNVDPSGPAFDLLVPVDVTIGTIPLRQTLQQYGFQVPPAPHPPPSAPTLDYNDPTIAAPPNVAMPGMRRHCKKSDENLPDGKCNA
ncbi:hypothetical protein KUTeg_017854 [Tegillarca granosa]|uniref:Arrestin C-terminal-like domain-containing protein n=1 Tax=Tegillarca granosa TaxID=220873 RepID=A0ABQ9EK56_TEGGR|nr:hypothetical protein KUTeg_017854 [Tegillarca granosa]